jgi:lipopolysaccharide transport system ATP-binding protein
MSEPIIKIENLGKKYLIQHRQAGPRYRALRDTLSDGVKSVATRLRRRTPKASASNEEFWALKDVSFDIHEGEVVGIIGRNGAGKSTLLKILSRITEPSAGRVTLNGRVASLLEVGTGFHPELTGRENIYLNGSILGMARAEIRRKFDEIVDFAEVEKFLDTPVKRYSSGMYVRLAFAVAAHLDPEILVVDEVLSVGDAAFQAKCLGKMESVATEQGRTVLLVSHNLGAILSMCGNAAYLANGVLKQYGPVKEVAARYANETAGQSKVQSNQFNGPLVTKLRFEKISINGIPLAFGMPVSPNEDIRILVEADALTDILGFRTTFALFHGGTRVLTMHDVKRPADVKQGRLIAEYKVPSLLLRPGEYSFAVGGRRESIDEWIWGTDLGSITIAEDWGPEYDQYNTGIINLKNGSSRR